MTRHVQYWQMTVVVFSYFFFCLKDKLVNSHLYVNLHTGLENLYQLTINKNSTLRIDMTKFDDKEIYVEYKDFFVTDAADLYRLHLGQPSGNAGDCVFLTSLTITF